MGSVGQRMAAGPLMLVSALLLCAGGAGCFSPDYGPDPFLCNFSQGCPSGYQCYNGLCTSRLPETALVVDARTTVRMDAQMDARKPADAAPGEGALRDGSLADHTTPDVGPPGSADLALTNLQVEPTSLGRGAHPTRVAFTISNKGPDALAVKSTCFTLAFFLSGNGTLGDNDDLSLGTASLACVIAVNGGANLQLSAGALSAITIPAEAANGMYYVLAKAYYVAGARVEDPQTENNVAKAASKLTVQ